MRLSSIVSLLVVTASFALGGCAADAEPSDGSASQPNVALSDKNKVIEPVDQSRTADVTQVGKVSDLYANPSDETRVRDVEKWATGTANPRIDVSPSGFGAVPTEKLGASPLTFQPYNQLEQGIDLEQGYLPYSHRPKDD